MEATTQNAGATTLASNPDAELIVAWNTYRDLLRSSYRTQDDEDGEELARQMNAPDKVIFAAIPTTVEGILAALRRIAPMNVDGRWLDRALAYDDDETLEERVDELNGQGQVLVRCILGLATIAKQARS